MSELRLDLAAGGYPIRIEEGLLARPEILAQYLPARSVLITNETLRPLLADPLAEILGASCVEVFSLPDGEQYKTLESVTRIHTCLLERQLGRDATLVAVGGGVVGDVTGFAAATYMRGIDFVQVPTTLLAQVDASVGGKTGVNHPLGKNMVGAFWQPRAVLIDPAVLRSLPQRELRAGMAEVIKYGLLGDAEFFSWLEEHIDALVARQPGELTRAIETSCRRKAEIVADDEREKGGARVLLNLGHTFAHAIETAQGYAQWLHGEAVACGMVLAADLSVRIGWLGEAEAARAADLIERAGLPVRLPEDLSAVELRAHMGRDKKNLDGRIRLVLLRGIGEACVTQEVEEGALMATLEAGGLSGD